MPTLPKVGRRWPSDGKQLYGVMMLLKSSLFHLDFTASVVQCCLLQAGHSGGILFVFHLAGQLVVHTIFSGRRGCVLVDVGSGSADV